MTILMARPRHPYPHRPLGRALDTYDAPAGAAPGGLVRWLAPSMARVGFALCVPTSRRLLFQRAELPAPRMGRRS